MRIYTTRQGSLELRSLADIWNAQVRYALTTIRRYNTSLSPCPHCVLSGLKYLSDPPGRDTWRTPDEAKAAGGDDCEGLSNLLLCALYLKVAGLAWSSAPALPVLGKFGSGRVLHAVVGVRQDMLPHWPGLERWVWERYPILHPKVCEDYVVIDPSWMCGMAFPLSHAEQVKLPKAQAVERDGKLYAVESLCCWK